MITKINVRCLRCVCIVLFTIHSSLFISVAVAQTPVYLDESMPVEQRIDDALSRMTLDEKIAVIHAQSKFSSPGVKRLGFPDLWTDDGPHGVRPDVLWDTDQRLLCRLPGTHLSGCHMESPDGTSLWRESGRRGALSQ